jgi:hypothetical protein
MERVKDPADPRRCRGAAPDGQCWNRAEPGRDYCRAHGGVSTQNTDDLKGFLLAKAEDRARLAQIDDAMEPVKELRDSINLAHMLIEKRYNAIKDENDLITACGPLNSMLLTMERLVTSAHRIEQNLGALLARNAIIRLAKSMVAIVVDELEGIDDYELIVDRITTRLIDTVRVANNEEEKDEAHAHAALPSPE